MKLQEYGYVRVGTAVPEVWIADPTRNAQEMIKLIEQAQEQQIEVLLFPELATTGYSCGELFNQDLLLSKSNEALIALKKVSAGSRMLIVVGAPLVVSNRLFNIAAVIHGGSIKAFVPKSHMPNYREFYEFRWFSDAEEINEHMVLFDGELVPIDENILICDQDSELKLAIEICEDLWVPNAPSIRHAQRGANLILNLSSSNEVMGKSIERRDLVAGRSDNQICGYIYTSSGHTESTTDLVFSGHCLIAEDGDILYENRFLEKGPLGFADIDYEKLQMERLRTNSFENIHSDYVFVYFKRDEAERTLKKTYEHHPFLPSAHKDELYDDVLRLQAIGLAQRMKRTGIEKSVIGVSGGLDSTWALIVIKKAHELLGLPTENILAVTMPGLGTSEKTLNNVRTLMNALNIPYQTIDIKESVLLHFRDIGHDPSNTKVVYENAQARERTQILMDIANKDGGLVVGTGDLSEIALGWATYNGDHMSMYSVNCSLPKTLIRDLMRNYADRNEEALKVALYDVLGTPVSPELLPPDAQGNLTQLTEDIVGDYAVNDFFLYQMVGFGFSPRKIIALATIAFAGRFDETELIGMLKNFYRRFITQQFKRNASPDGPKVTKISLSSRGDFKMPSDASYSLWTRELEQMEKEREH